MQTKCLMAKSLTLTNIVSSVDQNSFILFHRSLCFSFSFWYVHSVDTWNPDEEKAKVQIYPMKIEEQRIQQELINVNYNLSYESLTPG